MSLSTYIYDIVTSCRETAHPFTPGDSLCRCPVGKQGPACDKDTDADFDLEFFDAARTGAAYQNYAFELGTAAADELSVGLWVRYHSSQGQGTFFTLYGLE